MLQKNGDEREKELERWICMVRNLLIIYTLIFLCLKGFVLLFFLVQFKMRLSVDLFLRSEQTVQTTEVQASVAGINVFLTIQYSKNQSLFICAWFICELICQRHLNLANNKCIHFLS